MSGSIGGVGSVGGAVSVGRWRETSAGKVMAITMVAIVAPTAWPKSRVVSSIPEAKPRCSTGNALITVALLTVLKALVPTETGNNKKGMTHTGAGPEKRPSSTNPTAIETIQIGRSNLGL